MQIGLPLKVPAWVIRSDRRGSNSFMMSRAPTERPDRQPADDDLSEGGQVRLDPIQLLRTARRQPERDDLVEDEQHPMGSRRGAQPVQEPLVGWNHAAGGHQRFHDHGGQVLVVLLNQSSCHRKVVERGDQHFVHQRRPTARSRPVRRPATPARRAPERC